MTFKTEHPHNQAIDILRVISIFAVILIHTTSRTLETVHYDLQSTTWSFILNQISRFAVPLFFLISGFVLELNSGSFTNYFTYLKKRIHRIIIPYVFWSAVYYYFVYTHHSAGFFATLLDGSSSYQLYFIPSLLLLYLIFPLLHRMLSFLSRWWVLLPILLVQVYLQQEAYHFRPLPVYYPVNIAILNFFPFLIGMVSARFRDKLLPVFTKYRYLLFLAVIFFGGFVAWQGYTRYYQIWNFEAFYFQWRPGVLFYTLSLFGFCYYLFHRISIPPGLVSFLSRSSFFVYFVHIIVLENIWKYLGGHITTALWFDPVFFVLTAVISFTLAGIFHRIPHLSQVAG